MNQIPETIQTIKAYALNCSAFKSETSHSKNRPATQPLISSAPPQEIIHFQNKELTQNIIIQTLKLNLIKFQEMPFPLLFCN
jgi:hypothetical protein